MDTKELLRQYASGKRNFIGISLRSANLIGINLSEANLSNSSLRNAELHGANLQRTGSIPVWRKHQIASVPLR
ncbi:pentapeptide repeat-containing protein [Nostoc sp.]|uniref:pentapeptide repeat-containing protein n=1 Tax=Nostoc sp. TaxID=1180 RepID=UPI003FA5346F